MNTGPPSSPGKGNHYHRYLEYASGIISSYNGTQPFHVYLKKYFSTNKKHGSGDRKQITSLCYDYFRICFGVSYDLSINEKLLLGIFLIEKNPTPFLEKLNPEWNKNIHLDMSDKIEMVKNIFDLNKIFPFPNELSKEIAFQKFSLSFLIQPKLFIRIRPGYKNIVSGKLKSANISFEKINEDCLSFANNEKVSDILDIDKEAVIQDYNSQNTLDAVTSFIVHQTSSVSFWDCCAGSGGKSILANDLLKNLKITVSDNRKLILDNLKKRFAKSGIKNYHSFVADLSVSFPPEGIKAGYDIIIADVPCSGSGTWSRTPEQLCSFSEKNIKMYSGLQKKILTNVAKFLNENGYLLYITCSVFKKENEEVVDFILKDLGLELIESKYLKGYEMQADTLFAALFKNI
ncbi:MAG TPA: methyltransferase domain-containing protein [Hanamia sp.]